MAMGLQERIAATCRVEGHFQINSGHTPVFVDGKLAMRDGLMLSVSAEGLADRLMNHGRIEAILGPQSVARLLGALAAVLYRRQEASFLIAQARDVRSLNESRRFEIGAEEVAELKNFRTVIIDDVVTSKGSFRDLLGEANNAGAQVVGFACLWDRSVDGQIAYETATGETRTVNIHSIVTEQFPVFPEDNCPLCRAHMPLERR